MVSISIGKRGNNIRHGARGWLLTSPYLIFTAIFFLIPLVWSIFLVFQDWDLISPTPVFVGLANIK